MPVELKVQRLYKRRNRWRRKGSEFYRKPLPRSWL